MSWYVLFVETGKESLIQRWIKVFLNSNSCYSIFPKRLVTEKRNGVIEHVEKPLFPGYVFINIDMSPKNYYSLKKIPRFFKVLNNGEYYSKLNDYDIEVILKLTQNSNIIDYSRVFIENSNIVICEGPLKGMEGLIKKIDKRKKRATVEIQFLNKSRLVNLGIEFIEKD